MKGAASLPTAVAWRRSAATRVLPTCCSSAKGRNGVLPATSRRSSRRARSSRSAGTGISGPALTFLLARAMAGQEQEKRPCSECGAPRPSGRAGFTHRAPSGSEPAGRLLAFAYPDRLAQRRGSIRLLSHGQWSGRAPAAGRSLGSCRLAGDRFAGSRRWRRPHIPCGTHHPSRN